MRHAQPGSALGKGRRHADPSWGQGGGGRLVCTGPSPGRRAWGGQAGLRRSPQGLTRWKLGGHRAAAVAQRQAASGAWGPGHPGLWALRRPGARLGGKPP